MSAVLEPKVTATSNVADMSVKLAFSKKLQAERGPSTAMFTGQ